jgi:hypothetical protein
VKCTRQHGPDLARAARDDDLQAIARDTRHGLILMNMFTQNVKPWKRGTPVRKALFGDAVSA